MLTHVLVTFLLAVLHTCHPPNDLTVNQILEHVEKADVSTVTATVTYARTDPILDRREIRTGKVLFRMSESKSREAAILFDTLIIGRRKETNTKHYVFAGRFMAEIDHEKKQFIKRELVPPTEDAIDPFELGSGPIPLPIGQSKESILSKFTVEKTVKPEEGLLSTIDEDVVGLHLTPKQDDDWQSIDLFYDSETWLPVGVRTIESDGTKRVSKLTNIALNSLSEEEADALSMQTPDPKEWSIDIRAYSD